MKIEKLFISIIYSLISTLSLLIILSAGAYSQQLDFDKELTGKAVDGIANISSSIASDSFVPMTHWNSDEYRINAVPAFCDVTRAYDDPEIKGKDFKGFAAGIGGGYALSNRLLIYAIIANLNLKGKLTGNFYGNTLALPAIDAKIKYNLISFFPGLGYELMPSKGWLSVPVYLGPFIEYFSIDADFPQKSVPLPPSSIKAEINSNGFLYGFSGGFAVSARIMDIIKVTPYYLYQRSFNKPNVDAEVASGFGKTKQSLNTDFVNASMLGLSTTFVTSKSYSFSISIGGYITSQSSWYNDKFLNGLKMKSIIIAFTYTNPQDDQTNN